MPDFLRGEVWEAFEVPTRGDSPDQIEQKFRPVVIFQNDTLTANSETDGVVPITTNVFRSGPTGLLVPPGTAKPPQPSVILCDQLFTLKKTRFTKRFGKLPEATLSVVNARVWTVLGLPV